MSASSFQNTVFPCKNPQRYFGVDFFASIFQGSNPTRKFYASPADIDQTYRPELEDIKHMGTESFIYEMRRIPEGSVIGFDQNPDPYVASINKVGTMKKVLEAIKESNMGLYLETSSENVLEDIPIIVKISENAPVLIAIPVGFVNDEMGRMFEPSEPSFAAKLRLIRRFASENLRVGVILKPVIPFVNDSEENILQILNKAKEAGASFMYPSFGIIISDEQRPSFYSLIDKHYPGLKNIYMDNFGIRKSISSANAEKLKKAFVFSAKKMHVDFGMKEIIRSVKPTSDMQMKLF
ncbi:MAG TPA: hypothetical protein PLH02_00270 [Bacillota bacterium]|nr:hypothetical protein [Bacillota bacterium]HPQ61298.1 hypothetical protein [Bacillota bacterium]HRX91930.1 hypothetical protein [Candidatus Izemoplasmatales bacterium]